MFQDLEKTETTYYEIKVSGRLSPEWAEWFGDMVLTFEQTMENKTCTILSGPVEDQSALFGILTRIRDLGLRLISVNSIEPGLENGTYQKS